MLPMLDRKAIGDKLRALRGEAPRREVAAALGVSESALAMYEAGERIPRDEIKIAFSEYYHVPIEELFYTCVLHKRCKRKGKGVA